MTEDGFGKRAKNNNDQNKKQGKTTKAVKQEQSKKGDKRQGKKD